MNLRPTRKKLLAKKMKKFLNIHLLPLLNTSYYLEQLNEAQNRFLRISNNICNHEEKMQEYNHLLALLKEVETTGIAYEKILDFISPIRNFLAQAEWYFHAQNWPLGYPGDYRMIEAILGKKTQTSVDSPAYIYEEYALNAPISQQHRNKVKAQAQLIAEVLNQVEKPRILIMACGSAPDVFSLLDFLQDKDFLIVLNDSDQGALELTRSRLFPILDRCVLIHGNLFYKLREFTKLGPYDLIIAGGLYDYLTDNLAASLLNRNFNDQLKAGGRLFFTNIAKPHHFSMLMKYFVNWILIDRDEKEILKLIKTAEINPEYINITKDLTDLAFLIEMKKGDY